MIVYFDVGKIPSNRGKYFTGLMDFKSERSEPKLKFIEDIYVKFINVNK